MKQYELMFIVPGTLTEEEVAPHLAAVQSALDGVNATDVAVHSLGKAKLAYPMRHIRYGYFYNVSFTVAPEQVPELQRQLNLQKTLLRVIITATLERARTRDNAPEGLITIEKKQDLIDERKKAVARFKEETVPTAAPKQVEEETTTEVASAAEEEVSTDESPKKEAINLEDIDKKLDEIIKGDDISETL